jgi:hypothetical protein
MNSVNKTLENILDSSDSENSTKMIEKQLNHKEIVDILYPIYKNLSYTFGNGVQNLLYGEIEYPTLEIMTKYFPKLLDGYFYDLGCGRSKAVLYMNLTNNFKRCIGIDCVKERIDLSKEAYEKVNELRTIKNIKFYDKSFLDDKFNYKNASLIFINNLGFENSLNEQLFSKIRNEARNNTYLFVSNISFNYNDFEHLETLVGTMDWSDKTSVFVLRLNK